MFFVTDINIEKGKTLRGPIDKVQAIKIVMILSWRAGIRTWIYLPPQEA